MAKDTFFKKKETLNAGGRLMDLSRPKVMGIINLTPDSFYAGSRQQGIDQALKRAEIMLAEGAAFLDPGLTRHARVLGIFLYRKKLIGCFLLLKPLLAVFLTRFYLSILSVGKWQKRQ